MSRGFAWGAVGVLILSTAAGAFAWFPVPASPGEVLLWEAYARGWATITQVDVTYDRGGFTVTLPVGYLLQNLGAEDILIDEPGMLMSPSPADFGFDPADPTTQDGAITPGVIPAGTSQTFYYADETLQGFLPEPVWWCTEQFQFTQAGVNIVLGGEVLPPALQEVIRDPYHDSDEVNSQEDLWNHLKTFPAVVVGKTPLWAEIPGTAGQIVQVTVAATNIAVKDDNDQFFFDVDAVGVSVSDLVPAGWTVVPGSFSTPPTSTFDNPDGSKTLTWVVDIDAADVTGRTQDDLDDPTPYNGAKFRYKLETPRLSAGRVSLSRATVDLGSDGDIDAHSAIPVIDVFRVNAAPVAIAGGPYAGVEGSPISFDAGASFDPDGDSLLFRWDFESDGTWDTDWRDVPTSPELVFGDDGGGTLTVEAYDGELSSLATATYSIGNAPPTIDSLEVIGLSEGGETIVSAMFSDPGWLDTHFAFVDWGTGEMSAFPVESTHEEPAATGTFTIAHTYGDDFPFPGIVAVTDDDAGMSGGDRTFEVENLDPVLLDATATVVAGFGLRVAGEKWHDVTLDLYQGGDLLGSAGVVRMPGSPDDQTAWYGDIAVELTGDLSAVLTYTPDDDPLNGQAQGDNPAWLLVRFDDGTEARLHHNFNVNHEETWTWTVADLMPLFVGREITVAASASDAGSDDLVFEWDFGDGTTAVSVAFNDGTTADARPSPGGTFPFLATASARHAYPAGGPHTITLVVRDDDGGSRAVLIALGI